MFIWNLEVSFLKTGRKCKDFKAHDLEVYHGKCLFQNIIKECGQSRFQNRTVGIDYGETLMSFTDKAPIYTEKCAKMFAKFHEDNPGYSSYVWYDDDDDDRERQRKQIISPETAASKQSKKSTNRIRSFIRTFNGIHCPFF